MRFHSCLLAVSLFSSATAIFYPVTEYPHRDNSDGDGRIDNCAFGIDQGDGTAGRYTTVVYNLASPNEYVMGNIVANTFFKLQQGLVVAFPHRVDV